MASKKIIVTYYTRTETTKKVALAIADKLKCETEEIIDTKNRKGFLGWLRACADAIKERPTVIKNIKHNPSSYDIVVIGTPVWAGNITPAIRTYLGQNKDSLKEVAFFCTYSTSGEKALKNLAKLIGKEPVFSLGIKRKDVVRGRYMRLISEFFERQKITFEELV